jgi:uncharacterized protein (DUF2345 family)
MSIDRFADDPSLVKKATDPEGDNSGRNDGPQLIGVGNPAPYYEISVSDKPGQASDQTITHTGPGAGNMGGVGSATGVQGFVSATGNKVIIDNTFGSDTITMQHHSGAAIVIDSDGSIHLISTGKKGVGVISPRGDLTVYAQGHLILKGDGKVTIESQGDMDFNVGGSLGIHVGRNMITSVRDGSSEEVIYNGSKVVEVAKDMSTMVAGDNRITAAGKMQIQTPNTLDIDAAKNLTIRSDKTVELDAQQNIGLYAKEKVSINAKDTLEVVSEGAMTLSTKDDFALKADGTAKLSSTSAASIHSTSTIDVLASAKVNIKGSATDIQISGSPSVDSATDPGPAQLAQYPTADTIIKNITSLLDAPDFPLNAATMSAEEMSLYKNEGGNPNPKAEAYAAGNKGAGVSYQSTDTGITAEAIASGIYDRPAGISDGNGISETPGIPLPSSIYNSNEQLSRHVKVGQIIGIHNAPQSEIKNILTAAQNVAWNILDPLYEKFGARVYISSWWRPKSTNHSTGGAVDIRCSNKPDYGFTAEIASYVRDNLPYSKVLLEKNDEGGIHVHVEAAKPGQRGGGTVLTCADPHCYSSIPGLKLSYAVAALQGRKIVG